MSTATTTIPNTSIVKDGVYKYKRRVPKKLSEYFETQFITKELGTSERGAKAKVEEFTECLNKATTALALGLPPEEEYKLIRGILEPLKPHPLMSGGVIKIKKTVAVLTSMPVLKPFSHVAKAYLETLSISPNALREYTNILDTFTKLFDDKAIKSITHTDVDTAKQSIMKLPRRNKQIYKGVDVLALLDMDVPSEDVISNKTVNEYIKQLKAVYAYAIQRDIVTKNVTLQVKALPLSRRTREQREALSKAEITNLLSYLRISQSTLYLPTLICAYTGMRPTELERGQVKLIDGILCFDLTTPTAPLKTSSSYRVIPLHSSLIDAGIDESFSMSVSVGYLTRKVGKVVNEILEATANKSCYSMRHSFATILIQSGVSDALVSELMGHSHATMTLSRYTSGYTIPQLKEAVEKYSL